MSTRTSTSRFTPSYVVFAGALVRAQSTQVGDLALNHATKHSLHSTQPRLMLFSLRINVVQIFERGARANRASIEKQCCPVMICVIYIDDDNTFCPKIWLCVKWTGLHDRSPGVATTTPLTTTIKRNYFQSPSLLSGEWLYVWHSTVSCLLTSWSHVFMHKRVSERHEYFTN